MEPLETANLNLYYT